jgi:hypothetical protein
MVFFAITSRVSSFLLFFGFLFCVGFVLEEWHNFFVSELIGLKFWSHLHISIVYFLAKIGSLVLYGRSYGLLSELVKVKSILMLHNFGFTEGKNMRGLFRQPNPLLGSRAGEFSLSIGASHIQKL